MEHRLAGACCHGSVFLLLWQVLASLFQKDAAGQRTQEPKDHGDYQFFDCGGLFDLMGLFLLRKENVCEIIKVSLVFRSVSFHPQPSGNHFGAVFVSGSDDVFSGKIRFCGKTIYTFCSGDIGLRSGYCFLLVSVPEVSGMPRTTFLGVRGIRTTAEVRCGSYGSADDFQRRGLRQISDGMRNRGNLGF